MLSTITNFCLSICERTIAYSSTKIQNRFVDVAIKCLDSKITNKGIGFKNSNEAKDYFKCQLRTEKSEVFAVMFLDNKNCKIHFEKMFYGTINSSVVHPRIIVQKALALNAAALMIGHNHPSGNAEPSSYDIKLTKKLKDILAVIDVRLLEHVIVGEKECIALTEQSYL